jgi:septal ring factor EnvC (AmiA/AmiB activator)
VDAKAYRLTLVSFLLTCALSIVAAYNVWRGFDLDANARRTDSALSNIRGELSSALDGYNKLKTSVDGLTDSIGRIQGGIGELGNQISGSRKDALEIKAGLGRLASAINNFKQSIAGTEADLAGYAEINRRLRESLGL